MLACNSSDDVSTLCNAPSTILDSDTNGLVVEPLAPVDIKQASKSWYDAFLDDPMLRYIDCNEPPDRRKERAQRLVTSIGFVVWRQTKIVRTVEHGSAIVVVTPNKSARNPIARGVDTFFNKFLGSFGRLGQPEQRKRQAELKTKIKETIAKVLGDLVQEMWFVDLLCTNPQSQGHGYGSALLDNIKIKLDVLGRSGWLISSNINNEPFYNYHGFYSVADVYLGDDNDQWKSAPIKVQIMVREPNTRGYRMDDKSRSLEP